MPAYKDKKRKTWFVQLRYTDWTGKTVRKTKRGFATQHDAKAFEEEFCRTAGKSPDMTMSSFCQLYLDDLSTRRKANTVYSEECMIRRHILPYLGDIPINQITVSTVRNWQNQIMQAKAIYSKRPLSPHTLRNISVCLSSILNHAVRFYGLPQNPVQIARGMGKAVAHIDFWEVDEFNKFIDAVEEKDYKLFFTILFSSGMRLGEFLALTPADLDFQNNKINVTKTYNWKLKYSGPPKTETSVRTITMPENVMQEIKAYLESFFDPPDRVFAAATQKTLTARLAKYAARAGVKQIRLHDLRHSHASFLIHSNIPPTAIAQRLGHKNAKVTLEVYSHVYQASDMEIAEKIKSILSCRQNDVKNE